jgi:autotransporter-associated beta strand protein
MPSPGENFAVYAGLSMGCAAGGQTAGSVARRDTTIVRLLAHRLALVVCCLTPVLIDRVALADGGGDGGGQWRDRNGQIQGVPGAKGGAGVTGASGGNAPNLPSPGPDLSGTNAAGGGGGAPGYIGSAGNGGYGILLGEEQNSISQVSTWIQLQSPGGAGGTVANPNGQDGYTVVTGWNGNHVLIQGGSGGGGGGGFAGFVGVLGNAGILTGGNGGNGGAAAGLGITGGGGGGSGGYGAVVTGGGIQSNAGTITGGNGGNGGAGHVEFPFRGGPLPDGLAGSGGGGILFAPSASGAHFTNTGTITGGNGGSNPQRARAAGGAGIDVQATGMLIDNQNLIAGGSPGGGNGINGNQLTVINSGTITGAIGISGSNLAILNSGTIAGSTAAVAFTGGVNTLTLLPGAVVSGPITAGSADTLILGSNGSGTGSVSLPQGFGTIRVNAPGAVWTLNGVTTAATSWQFNAGVAAIRDDSAFGDGAGKLTFNGGTLRYTTSFDSEVGITLNPGGGVLDTGSFEVILRGDIGGSGGFTKTGSGILNLAGNNTYTGNSLVSGGTLIGDTSSLRGNIVDNAAVVFRQLSDGTYAGNLSGTGSLTKFGTGTLTLTGHNTYSGATVIFEGTLRAGAVGSLSPNSDFNLASGTTLDVNGFDNTVRSIFGDGTIALGNSALTFGAGNSDILFSGIVSGVGGSLVKVGTGTLTLTGANTYSGGTTINGGTLLLASDGSLGAATGALAFGGGTLRYQAAIDLTRLVTLNAGGGTFDTNGFTVTLGGLIGGAGGLTKDGAGTLVLTNGDRNSYTGATKIKAGTLRADTSNALGVASAVTVMAAPTSCWATTRRSRSARWPVPETSISVISASRSASTTPARPTLGSFRTQEACARPALAS